MLPVNRREFCKFLGASVIVMSLPGTLAEHTSAYEEKLSITVEDVQKMRDMMRGGVIQVYTGPCPPSADAPSGKPVITVAI